MGKYWTERQINEMYWEMVASGRWSLSVLAEAQRQQWIAYCWQRDRDSKWKVSGPTLEDLRDQPEPVKYLRRRSVASKDKLR